MDIKRILVNVIDFLKLPTTYLPFGAICILDLVLFTLLHPKKERTLRNVGKIVLFTLISMLLVAVAIFFILFVCFVLAWGMRSIAATSLVVILLGLSLLFIPYVIRSRIAMKFFPNLNQNEVKERIFWTNIVYIILFFYALLAF